MRFVDCVQSWHSFDDLHCHLLLMMDFDCPLAFCHKKGEYIFERALCFVFRGRAFFCWLELVELFRLYLGASHCILPFYLLPHLFCSVEIFMLGGIYFLLYMFLVSTAY